MGEKRKTAPGNWFHSLETLGITEFKRSRLDISCDTISHYGEIRTPRISEQTIRINQYSDDDTQIRAETLSSKLLKKKIN